MNTLDQLKVGEEGMIKEIYGNGPLRCRLLDMGFTPRTKVMVRKIAPMGDPMEIHIRGYEITIRMEEARKIEIIVEDKE